ncbi:MAG: ferritin [Clostridia bacterium]|nr:ferritin [Clostridia bacterium]
MLQKKVLDLIQDQINKELYSAYLYVDMANFFEDEGLPGFAHWYENQAEEEVGHAKRLRRYLIDSGESVKLEAIAKPDKVFKNIEDPLNAGYEHECYVSSLIHNIYGVALECKDYRTMNFLEWFIEEQAEEEKNSSDLITRMKRFGGDPAGLQALDKSLGKRED